MDNSNYILPSTNMEFWKIENSENVVTIKWSRNYFEDYKSLSYNFYNCGISTLDEVISSGHDNVKSDTWFLTGIFLIRQSIELGLKAIICRIHRNANNNIQNAFQSCCHDLSKLFQICCDKEDYLSNPEKTWLSKYFISLEEVDSKSDMFRFPFEDEFLAKYRNKFLDNVAIANNLLQAFALVKKCIQQGTISADDQFDPSLQPEFFIFATHGIGNCYLWQPVSDQGFYVKVTGYSEVIDYIYNCLDISKADKFYPLMFMFRNTIELCLKRLLYANVMYGVPVKVIHCKRRSHFIKKDLWANIRPVIYKYATDSDNNLETLNNVDKLIDEVSKLDKNGDMFRYPTSYSLEYRFDNKRIDIKNVYEYNKAIINFLDGCDSVLDACAEYEAEMLSYIDWY